MVPPALEPQSCSLWGHSLQRVSGDLLVTPTTVYFPCINGRLVELLMTHPKRPQTSDTT